MSPLNSDTALILTCAGLSTRYPDTPPKWKLTAPSTSPMFVESVSALPLQEFTKIVVVLSRHDSEEVEWARKKMLERYPEIRDRFEVIALPISTPNQPSTVFNIIKDLTNSLIFVKDCDGKFALEYPHAPMIAYCSLTHQSKVCAGNKSYIRVDSMGWVVEIVEKRIISDTFCVGGYCFEREPFCTQFRNLPDSVRNHSSLYMSHILSLIMEDRHFLAVQATEYQDWGTQEDWYQYMRERPVLFVDIDGTLIANHISPIDNNIKVINKMVERGAHLIITTSRPEQDRERTIAQLEKFGIRYSQLIMGLPHTSRVIINDFFPTNPYPSAVAINIPRDCDDLGAYLGMSVK